MPIILAQRTSACPEWIIEAGKYYQVSREIARLLCAETQVVDQPGTPEHGKTVKIRPAAVIVERPPAKAKVHRLPPQPDPEDVPGPPLDDEMTETDDDEE